MTDPIADMLTRIRNAARAKHSRVDVPASKLKTEIARVLKEEGYISTYKLVDDSKAKKVLRVFLKYSPDRQETCGVCGQSYTPDRPPKVARRCDKDGGALQREMAGKRSVITDLRRVSRPGCRQYVTKTEIRAVVGGMGVSILSTPRGLMTGRAARRTGIGGEVLCEVW